MHIHVELFDSNDRGGEGVEAQNVWNIVICLKKIKTLLSISPQIFYHLKKRHVLITFFVFVQYTLNIYCIILPYPHSIIIQWNNRINIIKHQFKVLEHSVP